MRDRLLRLHAVLALTLPLAPSVAATNDAKFLSIIAPASVAPGATFTATITMKNTGDATWTSAGSYSLGSQAPMDNLRWGSGRVALSGPVAPLADAAFTASFTAPTRPGVQNFVWKMVQDGVEWFGEPAVARIKIGADAAFMPGDLVVLQVGDGVNALANTGSAIVLNSYAPAGGDVKFQVALPTIGADALIQGSNAFTGMVDLSSDRRQLIISGYNTNLPAGASIEIAGSPISRAVGTVEASGSYILQARATSGPAGSGAVFNGGTFRGAVSDGQGNFWAGAQNGGIQYLGTHSPPVKIDNAGAGAIRDMMMVNGSIYFSTSQFPAVPTSGLVAFAGAPTTASAPQMVIEDTGTTVPGTTGTANPKGFFINPNLTIAYVVDMRTIPNGGGIYRYEGTGTGAPGSWTYAYTIINDLDGGATGLFQELAVDFSGANPVIFATTGAGIANSLVTATDAGPATATFSLLETAEPLTAFRGLTFAPIATIAPPSLTIAHSGSDIVITWSGGPLESSPDLTTWADLTPQPPSPLTIAPASGTKFYRVRGQ